jgi:glycerol-3-phosphate dehydrogenase (NAD(P)+)
MNTTVIGTGGWGTALAVLLHGNGHRVALWGRMSEEVEPIWAARENKAFLPGVKIPEAIRVTLDENEALRDAELVVLAVPSHGMRTICGKIRNHIPSAATLVSVAKGIETETGARMSRVIGDALTTTLVRETDAVRDTETRAAYNASHPVLDRLVVLSGPSHAEEVGRGIPTAVVVASMNPTAATKAQQAFMNERFRVYTHDDVIGVELGGALKNIIALAAGVHTRVGGNGAAGRGVGRAARDVFRSQRRGRFDGDRVQPPQPQPSFWRTAGQG